MDRALTPVDSLQPLLKGAYKAFCGLIRFLRTRYVMDEQWDGEGNLKFRRNGRTLVTLALRDGRFNVLIIFGKAERERFEAVRDNFSPSILRHYDDSRIYHDGKWMFMDIEDDSCLGDIMEMLKIKKKPNRKDMHDPEVLGRCGNSCGSCLLYVKNNEKGQEGSRAFYEMEGACYFTPGEARAAYAAPTCPGCAAKDEKACASFACMAAKGVETCFACDWANCTGEGTQISAFDPALCNLGVTAQEVTGVIMPYCGRQRYEAMKARG